MAGLFDTLMQRRKQYQTGTTGHEGVQTEGDAARAMAEYGTVGNGLMSQLRPDITDPEMRKRMGLPPLPTPRPTGVQTESDALRGTAEQEAYMRQLMNRFK